MNAKRQTIWLISMLSLMVVLSAYYLFSDSLEEINTASEQAGISDMDAIDVSEVTDENADEADDHTVADPSATDEEILKKVQAEANKGEDFFASIQLQRNEALAKETERLMTIITDSKQNTEAVGKAYDDLNKIEEKQAKITNVEDMLMKDYPNVVVTESAGQHWKVIVQSDKLEKSEAVSIIDLVMSELNLTQDKISVQYIP